MSRFVVGLLALGWCAPTGLGQTTLYVADGDDGMVKQILPGGGSFTNYATGFSTPVGLAMAASGNLYVSDLSAGTVRRIPAGGGPAAVYATGFSGPAGIAVDAGGFLYVADQG